MQCSIARTLEHVGSWWSLLIIRDAMMGARKFSHFEHSLGISKNTLATRLSELIEGGILEKVSAPLGGRRDEYVLTKQGRDLAPVIIALAQWGDKWVAHEEGPSTTILNMESGEKLSRIWPRGDDGALLPLSAVRMKRSKSAPPLSWRSPKQDGES